jgi:hypothetical protein
MVLINTTAFVFLLFQKGAGEEPVEATPAVADSDNAQDVSITSPDLWSANDGKGGKL